MRQMSAELSPSGEIAQVEIDQTPFAGFYELQHEGAGGATTYFAANAPRLEGDLTALDERTLRERYRGLDFHMMSRAEDLRRKLNEERVGREIWHYLFALAVACIAAEILLALKWAPREG
jgi:hypothetical protein